MKQVAREGRVGILVGGGPAPGINGVIGAVTMAAVSHGFEVVGIYDGFKWLCRHNISHVRRLRIKDVETARFRGGSILRTSRENPTEKKSKMRSVLTGLRKLGIRYLVTIGGDDTAFSAYNTARLARGAIRVAHVPKTIDNDLPLPDNIPTFGFETARHVGAELVRNLVEDARTTSRWYVVVAMGRSAGHLALGMGISGGASLTLIPEEFRGRYVRLEMLCNMIEASIAKASRTGREYGVVVIAEGLAELMKDELAKHSLVVMKHDKHGNLRLAEVPFALIIKRMLDERAKNRGQDVTYVDTTIGYDLRCADPIPLDVEYTQQLGWGAVQYLLRTACARKADREALISIQAGKVVPIALPRILDTKTGKTKVRRVRIKSDLYRSARASMIR